MTRTPPEHDPAAVAIFLQSATPYYVGKSYHGSEHIGYLQGWYADEAEAHAAAERIAKNAERNGRCARGFLTRFTFRRATKGQIAALMTGANIRDLFPA